VLDVIFTFFDLHTEKIEKKKTVFGFFKEGNEMFLLPMFKARHFMQREENF